MLNQSVRMDTSQNDSSLDGSWTERDCRSTKTKPEHPCEVPVHPLYNKYIPKVLSLTNQIIPMTQSTHQDGRGVLALLSTPSPGGGTGICTNVMAENWALAGAACDTPETIKG